MNASTALATVLIDEWVRCGVTEVVVCPGSRSAPLAYAALEAEQAGRLRLHVRVDERSAGFLALGLAKLSWQPTVVIMTSGTAVANLHPAVLEASHACVPMIVMSADRPAELRGTGANQTTVQPGIFAGPVRFEHDQPPAQGRIGEQASWRSTVCRCYAAAVGRAGDAGPVHLNVALRDPLAPDRDVSADWPESLGGRLDGKPWVAWSGGKDGGAAADDRVSQRHTKTLMILGDLADPAMGAQAISLAQRKRWPVIAEPWGRRPAEPGGAVLPHGPLLLADTAFLDGHLPERLLIVGRHTLHRDIAALARRPGMTVEQVSAVELWSDPSHVVSRVLTWHDFLHHPPEGSDSSWSHAWIEAGQQLTQRVAASEVLRTEVAGVSIAATVLDTLDQDDTLVLGSSNTPRDLNLADSTTAPRALIVGNRGLSGIDGTVSCAVGVGLSVPGAGRAPEGARRSDTAPGQADAGAGRVLALMGDLTFEHDINGLLIGPDEPRPDLTIVVNNDSGGGIFATLEYGKPEYGEQLGRLFTTPTGADIEALCGGYDVSYRRVDTLDGLRRALSQPATGVAVIEVAVDPATDQRTRAELRAIAAGY
ncbi:MAG: 2-succinyl-5-enolpyruvyl-6-hydroxy-3-cyclohexene-1-carboxylic-acid synthase [Ornithinimicrobium sp.]